MKRTSLESHHQEGYHESARAAGDPVEILREGILDVVRLTALFGFLGMVAVIAALASGA